MPLFGYFIDANLLVLLVVGRVGRELIAKHRRLRGYTGEDYDLLHDLLERGGRIFVTPNTLTEASNLLGQHGEPERSRLFEMLRRVIQSAEEVIIASEVAASNSEFIRLGITDAALLETATEDTPLITVDLNLYLAALSMNKEGITAVNFNHIRNS